MKKFTLILLLLIIAGSGLYYLGNKTVFLPAPEEKIVLENPKTSPQNHPEIELPKLEYSMPSPDDLDELTATIVGMAGATIEERNNLVWGLKEKNLRKEDFEAIFTFLKTNPREKGSQLAWHSLKNDLLVFTIDDGRYKENTAQLMIDIINDKGQHEVMREYTLQYIPDYFEKHWLEVNGAIKKEKSSLSEIDLNLQQAFVSTMYKMLEDRNGPIPGTALIRLHELSKHFRSIDALQVEKAVENMINDQSMPVSSRMAALSVAAERQLKEAVEMAEQLTFDETSPVSLRMAALHTASTMTDKEGFVKKLEDEFIKNQSVDKRLQRAASDAVKLLKNKRG